MNKLLLLPIHKLVILILLIAVTYLLLYELWWIEIPSITSAMYKLGIITSKIAYSILAASIFYVITQYIGIYIPKQRRKVKIILPYVHRQVLTLDTILGKLRFHLNIQNNEFKNNETFGAILEKVNTDNPVGEYQNWYQFLHHIKLQILDVIRGIYFYNEYLSEDFLHEVVLIEERLMSPTTFIGHRTLGCTDLRFSEIDIQEILVHNLHLQDIRKAEAEKHKKQFASFGSMYREKYYNGKI